MQEPALFRRRFLPRSNAFFCQGATIVQRSLRRPMIRRATSITAVKSTPATGRTIQVNLPVPRCETPPEVSGGRKAPIGAADRLQCFRRPLLPVRIVALLQERIETAPYRRHTHDEVRPEQEHKPVRHTPTNGAHLFPFVFRTDFIVHTRAHRCQFPAPRENS